MKAAALVAVDAKLEAPLKPEQRLQRIGFSHIQIVGGEELHIGTAQQRRTQWAIEKLGTAAHHKGHGKAGCNTGLELISDRVQQRIAAADMKPRVVYCRVLHHQPGVKASAR